MVILMWIGASPCTKLERGTIRSDHRKDDKSGPQQFLWVGRLGRLVHHQPVMRKLGQSLIYKSQSIWANKNSHFLWSRSTPTMLENSYFEDLLFNIDFLSYAYQFELMNWHQCGIFSSNNSQWGIPFEWQQESLNFVNSSVFTCLVTVPPGTWLWRRELGLPWRRRLGSHFHVRRRKRNVICIGFKKLWLQSVCNNNPWL